MQAFETIFPQQIKYPIVLSLPHIGMRFPDNISKQIKPEMLAPDDTDWHLDQLYHFVNELGIPVIKSVYSRWVIDLNRNPDNLPLYNDGRIITHACTTTNFLGNNIYLDERNKIDDEAIAERKELYFKPYHNTLQQMLDKVKAEFGKVLLWDGHSIRRKVTGISDKPFADFIIGTNDDNSVPVQFSQLINQHLKKISNDVVFNYPFKGGYITRHYGKPKVNQYAVQLEMSKDLYMDESEQHYGELKARPIQQQFIKIFQQLGEMLL